MPIDPEAGRGVPTHGTPHAALALVVFVGRRWMPAATAAVFLLVTVEAFRAPMGYVATTPPPGFYGLLGAEPRAVVAELPMADPLKPGLNAVYMLNSTRHWRPLLNGYSGFVPESYVHRWEQLRSFPSGGALHALAAVGVTNVIAHRDIMPPFAAPPTLELIGEAGAVAIYRVRPERTAVHTRPQ